MDTLISVIFLMIASCMSMTGCTAVSGENEVIQNSYSEMTSSVYSGEADTLDRKAPKLLYQGQASIRVITPENKVIYIDPYAGNGYDMPADLILVTHSHFDHNAVDKIENRNDDCTIITQNEAIKNGEHQIFNLDFVTVEAVEAGYNKWHDVSECVGYVLTFSNGKSIYVTGDTSTTEQMPKLAELL